MTMLHNLPDLVVELGVADLSALQFACDLKSLFFISCQDAITTVITTIIITVTMIVLIRLHLPVMSASASARASLSFSFLQETNQEKYNNSQWRKVKQMDLKPPVGICRLFALLLVSLVLSLQCGQPCSFKFY